MSVHRKDNLGGLHRATVCFGNPIALFFQRHNRRILKNLNAARSQPRCHTAYEHRRLDHGRPWGKQTALVVYEKGEGYTNVRADVSIPETLYVHTLEGQQLNSLR